jgi:hypothetical protein
MKATKTYTGLPTNKLIIGYKDIFEKKPDFGRIEILKGISKENIIAELAGLNYRLKGQKSKFVDTSFVTQQDELFYFCGKNKELYMKYASLIDTKTCGREAFTFSRQACLYGIEEIIQSDLPIIEGFKMSDQLSSWEALLIYILCINDEVTKIEENDPDTPINFETLNPKLLPISELMLISDPFYIVYRGWNLMIYLEKIEETKQSLIDYFTATYQCTYERFIFEILRMWMANRHQHEHLNFYYQLPDDESFKYLFDRLSNKYNNAETHKLLNIRKHPFFKMDEKTYMLTDLSNLLDKAYYQFINDFFFDKLKGEKKSNGKVFSMQDYKAIIGQFFQEYVRDKLEYSFKNSRNYIVKMFEQLEVRLSSGRLIECGDVYIRNENKVIIGEVKASSLYDNERYGGNVDAMYKNNRDTFFKNFGVDQLVNNIINIDRNIEDIDKDFTNRKKIRIWPVIILNEKAFQTPLMAQIFSSRFKELMGNYNDKRKHVYPLTLLHLSDLENMECELNKSPHLIWDLLSNNFGSPTKFIPPFYNTLHRNDIRADYKRFKEKVKILFDKFSKGNTASPI